MGGRGYGGGGRGRAYTYLYTVTTRMTCIKMGSDESHLNVSSIVRDKVTRQCPQTTEAVPHKSVDEANLRSTGVAFRKSMALCPLFILLRQCSWAFKEPGLVEPL